MAKIKAPDKPTIDNERELESVVDNTTDYVAVRNKRIPLKYLNQHAKHKISKIMLAKGGDELSVGCKCLAAARLNGYFKIKFLYWFLWRWYYYIKQYTDGEILEAINVVKKKAAAEDYFIVTTLLIGIKETMMMMSREEVTASLQELSTAKAGKSAKNAPGSQNRSESSESR